ncbi:MAG TPA: bifunctional phosphoribosylaminoimidazolecarboxamide formyltransferase/IMP cyclohydrolase, partial [archaeon]|nr:bifunctional phosphoribosylaminoimidazolecarboxamide formyltransferase/IMP cyclohydrolase [archaeon]
LKKGQKKQRRLFKTKPYSSYHWDVRLVDGAFLVQEQPDFGKRLQETAVSFPTKLKPDADALKVLLTAHEVVRKVPSNGILVGDGVVKDGIVESFWTYGVGSSTKRSRAVQIALEVAGGRARNAILASDGFFPFPDSVELAGERGVKAIIQPGGSLRDHLSIQKADQLGIAMAFRHARIFSH